MVAGFTPHTFNEIQKVKAIYYILSSRNHT